MARTTKVGKTGSSATKTVTKTTQNPTKPGELYKSSYSYGGSKNKTGKAMPKDYAGNSHFQNVENNLHKQYNAATGKSSKSSSKKATPMTKKSK